MRRSIFTFLSTHLLAVLILVSRGEVAAREYHCDKQISIEIKYIRKSLETIYRVHERVLSECLNNTACENVVRYYGSFVNLYNGHDFNVDKTRRNLFKTSVPAKFRHRFKGSPYSVVASCKMGSECTFLGIVYKVPSETSKIVYNDVKCSDIKIYPLDIHFPLRLPRTSSKRF
ncbi:BgtE-5607_reanotated [Blumeria graminis f. sp. tritici]|uniref:BgtE-5607_reanotated n=2 Tax=Blumeria graminis f. sp. tritici TaxID=62690 RepID=A0A9X9MJ64_BLUGR|nr:putative secreted effector protein [Blumeria graminis f. sp. tritici 96224]VDB89662.1 BgtE-5607_reanotated [Blumeria graminis f. sp. tritici]